MNLFVIALALICCNNPSTQQDDKQPIISEGMQSPLCEGTEALIQHPKSFGIVIGDASGVIISASSTGNELTIFYEMSEAKSSIQGKCTGHNWQSDGQSKLTLQFNNDGTAKGKDKDGKDVYILIGEKSTDEKVIADLKNKNLLSLATGLVTKNKLPGHDAPTWYYHQTADRLQISFVFPVGFVHPSYGPQNHVRIFIFEKQKGEWSVVEDNSSVNS
jgi:hypothetical protein